MPWESLIPPSLAFSVYGIKYGHQGIWAQALALPLLCFFSLCFRFLFFIQVSSSDTDVCHALDLGSGAPERDQIWVCPWETLYSGGVGQMMTGHSSEGGNSGTMATEGSPSEGEGKSFEGVVSSRVTVRSNMKIGRNCYYPPENSSPRLWISGNWELYDYFNGGALWPLY